MSAEQLYHHSFQYDEVREGDILPVGGGMMGSADMPQKVRVDFGNFYESFAAIADRRSREIQTEEWRQWLGRAPDVDQGLLAHLQTFTTAFEPKFQRLRGSKYQRMALYEGAPDKTMELSEVFNKNQAMCVEVALLAKKYLDTKGVKSRFISGDIVPDYTGDGLDIPVEHAFLVIDSGGKEFVFDPAKPNRNKDGAPFLSLSRLTVPFSEKREEMRRGPLMISAEDVITGRTRYYGVADGGFLPPGRFIQPKASAAPA